MAIPMAMYDTKYHREKKKLFKHYLKRLAISNMTSEKLLIHKLLSFSITGLCFCRMIWFQVVRYPGKMFCLLVYHLTNYWWIPQTSTGETDMCTQFFCLGITSLKSWPKQQTRSLNKKTLQYGEGFWNEWMNEYLMTPQQMWTSRWCYNTFNGIYKKYCNCVILQWCSKWHCKWIEICKKYGFR